MKLLAVVLVVTVGQGAGNLWPACTRRTWIPYTLKQHLPLITSNECNPSYISRNPRTSGKIDDTLSVPRGVPLSLFCGLCVQNKYSKQLTISTEQEGAQLPQTPILSKEESPELELYSSKCWLNYALAQPVEESGSWRCNIKFGAREMVESISYEVRDAHVNLTHQDISAQNTVLLTCPEHPEPISSSNRLIHVWYRREPSGRVGLAKPTTAAHVEFEVQSGVPLRVSCATYYLTGPSQVFIKDFTVSRSYTSHRTDYGRQSPGGAGSGANDPRAYYPPKDPPASSTQTALITSLVVMVALLAVVAAFAIARMYRRARY